LGKSEANEKKDRRLKKGLKTQKEKETQIIKTTKK
jgi:hypothetical protein